MTALIDEGHEIIVSAPVDDKTTDVEQLGCKVIDTQFNRKGTNPINDLALIIKYRKLLKKIKPDVVLSYTTKPNLYGGIACQLLGIPQIANITGLGVAVEYPGLLQRITILLYKIGLRKTKTVFFQNIANKDFCLKHRMVNGQYKLIPGSGVNIDFHSFQSYPDVASPLKFVFISRLIKQKGIEEYFKAAERIKVKHPEIEFHIVGWCEDAYSEKLKELEDKGIVIYHGPVGDIRPIVGMANCTVHPSFYPEGMSNVLLESCSAGRPIITTDRPGCGEIIDDGVNGFVVKQCDTDDLVKKIEMFITLPYEQKKRMGKEARIKVEREFDRQIVVENYINEINSIMWQDIMVQRCKKCHLPANYPCISFNKEGICNYCQESLVEHNYLGMDQLKKTIDSALFHSDPTRKYDCVVGLSGGRDSSYLLYFAKVILNLRVLAVSVDHDFITPLARKNIKTIVDKVGVDIVYLQNDVLNRESRRCVHNWSQKPDVAMAISFCTGCRYGINKLLPDYVRKHKIPIMLTGHVPIEGKMDFRVNLLCDEKEKNIKNFAIGYAKRLLKNPSYLKSIGSLYHQYIDFVAAKNIFKGDNPIIISPFYFIEWKEETVLSKIIELGWQYDAKEFSSSWRSDCYVGVLRQFVYKKMLGFNDVDVYYANRLRYNKIEYKDALTRIKEESEDKEDTVRYVLKEFYNINYLDLVGKISNNYSDVI